METREDRDQLFDLYFSHHTSHRMFAASAS
jgi:hypothetical protein